jgi:CubicO group peptidase (beta-lactamase class C family)
MNKIYLLILFFAFSVQKNTAQQIDDVRQTTINDFFEGYNSQDFKKMRNEMITVMKVFFTKKNVALIYGRQFEMMGKVKVEKVTKQSEQVYFIDLKYERDTTEIQRIGLSITQKGKIMGMSNPSLKFLFPKSDKNESFSEITAKEKIDSIANLKHNVANFNGCVLVLKDNKPFYQSCFGYSDFENKTPLNENTLFDLASLSKQFTAMTIMLLKKQGKLDYTQKIEDIIPDFPYKNITIQNLLNHTSGLPDYTELFEENWDKSKIAGNKDVLEYLIKYKPKTSFKPGEEYEYSNTGYVVLSLIVEKVSGKTYSQFINDNILEPLEMTRSKVYNTKYSENEIMENYAKGYAFDSDLKKYISVTQIPALDYYRYLDGITGDGSVNSTISDLAKWDFALREHRFISRDEFNSAIEPAHVGNDLSEYGFGWELQTNDTYQKLIYHSGSWGGNFNFILHFLEKDITVIILCNNQYLNVGKFAYKIGEIMSKL